MMIIFDGPEKSGKTTLIRALAEYLLSLTYDVKIRHWGRLTIDDREYTPAIDEDLRSDKRITLWDRGWPAEHVYGNLLKRDRRLADDPWLGEWLHRRAFIGNGMSIIVAPAVAGLNIGMHDETDLPVDVYLEREKFMAYASRFKWRTLMNDYTQAWLERNVIDIAASAISRYPDHRMDLSKVIFITDTFVERGVLPGNLLPFTTRVGTALARQIGDIALCAKWTTLDAVSDWDLERATGIVGFGERSSEFVRNSTFEPNQITVTLPFKVERKDADKVVEDMRDRNMAMLRPILEKLERTWNETAYL